MVTMHSVHEKGFTLSELLIVIALLGLLFVGSYSYINPKAQLAKGRDSRRKKDFAVMKRVLEDYHNDHEQYPPLALMDCSQPDLLKPYISRLPCDPNGVSYVYKLCDADGRQYSLYGRLENSQDLSLREQQCGGGCIVDGAAYNYAVTSGGSLCGQSSILPTPT